MKRYKKLILSGVFILIVAMSFVLGRFSNTENEYLEDKPKQVKEKNLLSYYLENENGEYEAASSEKWPTDGYKFNATLSKCENGGELGWDSTKGVVTMTGNMSDKCYVYFDKALTLASYVKALYTGIQGENNIYYHGSDITGLQDNSYRYVGASSEVNNYVCFGSTDATCPTDNLYRIIGVFGEQVKLIKAAYVTSLAWGPIKGTTWSTSPLNTYLNESYLTNLGDFANKIATTAWKVGKLSNGGSNDNIYSAYVEEIEECTEEYSAKIGLMYITDYGFAINVGWSTLTEQTLNSLSEYTTDNWMYIGVPEWTISISGNQAFYVTSEGNVVLNLFTTEVPVRPTFYLNSGVTYVSGSGSSTDPIRIS